MADDRVAHGAGSEADPEANECRALALAEGAYDDDGAVVDADVYDSDECTTIFTDAFTDLIALLRGVFPACRATEDVESRWKVLQTHPDTVMALMTIFKLKCDKHADQVRAQDARFVESLGRLPIIAKTALHDKYLQLNADKQRPLFWDCIAEMQDACTLYANAADGAHAQIVRIAQSIMVSIPPSETRSWTEVVSIVGKIVPQVCNDEETRSIMRRIVMNPHSLETCVDVIVLSMGDGNIGATSRSLLRTVLQGAVTSDGAMAFVAGASSTVASAVEWGRKALAGFNLGADAGATTTRPGVPLAALDALEDAPCDDPF